MRLRATTRVQNDEMISKRKALGLTQADLSKACEVSTQLISRLECLDYKRQLAAFEQAKAIADFLDMEVENVFPRELIGKQFNTKMIAVKVIDNSRLIEYADERLLLSYEGNHKKVDQSLISEILEHMSDLSLREQEMVKLRHGLTDGREYTYSEVAGKFDITKERARQIINKALAKVKNKIKKAERHNA